MYDLIKNVQMLIKKKIKQISMCIIFVNEATMYEWDLTVKKRRHQIITVCKLMIIHYTAVMLKIFPN